MKIPPAIQSYIIAVVLMIICGFCGWHYNIFLGAGLLGSSLFFIARGMHLQNK